MMTQLSFYINAVLLGIALAMDAFSISLANGLNEPSMKKSRMCLIAGTFGLFQILMPLVGWICVHTIVTIFVSFQRYIPWIAMILLLYIGGKMLYEGLTKKDDDESPSVGMAALILQGIATSIDALSVGFTIAHYDFIAALVESLIIGVVTFGICMGGLLIGRKFGTKLAGKANILGGLILIAIGIEIFIKGLI